MYRPSQSQQPNLSTTKGCGSRFVSMQIYTAQVCLFLLLCKVRVNHVGPLSPTGSHRLNDLSMLAWSHTVTRTVLGSKDYHPSWLPSITSETYCLVPLAKALSMVKARESVEAAVRRGWVTKGLGLCWAKNRFPLGFKAAVRPLWH